MAKGETVTPREFRQLSENPTRNFMEERFGADFGHVRVHTGSDAVQLNRDVGAQAFTHGNDIHLGGSQGGGDALLGHELTHVVQQHNGGFNRPG